jgi:hypothetical protein
MEKEPVWILAELCLVAIMKSVLSRTTNHIVAVPKAISGTQLQASVRLFQSHLVPQIVSAALIRFADLIHRESSDAALFASSSIGLKQGCI